MKISRLSLLSLSLITASAVYGDSSLDIKPIPDLKPVSDYPSEKIDEISRMALKHWPFLAEESPKVAGTFRTVRAIPDFSQKGDLIWEVRIVHMSQAPSGILWINDRTKGVLVLGDPK